MRQVRFLFGCFVAFSIVSCSSLKITYDYDSKTDFTKFKTYSLSEDTYKMKIDDINKERIINAVESELSLKGFTKSTTPDAIIDLHLRIEQKVDVSTTSSPAYPYGGPWRYGYGYGFSTTEVNYYQYLEGTLFINLVDAKTERIVWQGRGVNTINKEASPKTRETNIRYAVKRIFEKYPPKLK